MSSSSLSLSSSQKRNSAGSGSPLRQNVLEDVLRHELHWATFEAPPSKFGASQANWLRSSVDQVMQSLAFDSLPRGFVAGTSAVQDQDQGPPKKKVKLNERSHYSSVATLLNDLVHRCKALNGYHTSRNLTFDTYDAQMGLVGGVPALQPGIMGIHGSSAYDIQRRRCMEAEQSLQQHKTTFAQAQDAMEKRDLQAKIKELKKIISEAFTLEWLDVEIAVEVKKTWSIMLLQASTYGRAMLLTRKSRLWAPIICLNEDQRNIRFLFFHRGGLLSSTLCDLRTTSGFRDFVHMIVFILSRKDGFEAGMDLSRTDVSPWEWEQDLCYRASLRGRSTEVIRLKKYVIPHELPGLPSASHLPPPRHPPTAQTEGTDTYGGVVTPEEQSLQPEIRGHMRNLIGSDGESLKYALGPKQLLTAIVHGLIGYLNLFNCGWVHRDINAGNVLMFKTPMAFSNGRRSDAPPNAPIGETFDQEVCTNMYHGSGAIPFMSRRLLNSCSTTDPHPHTPLDDLESMFWVLVWFLLGAGAARQLLSPDESKHWRHLSCTNDPELLKSHKDSFVFFARRILPRAPRISTGLSQPLLSAVEAVESHLLFKLSQAC
ncbi:hypothetical protein FB451DRAFT_1531114 [Mycena latifolia]|nr:hypothetical protein FB451DRAFT_1531114 [Mycena latifolia]